MLTPSQNKALYPLLQYYTGSEIQKIIYKENKAIFSTKYGQIGELIESDNGDWKIIIEEEEIGLIEKIVFETLIIPDKRSTVIEYVKKLDNLLDSSIRYKSKILVTQTIKVLEGYIINSDFIPEKSVRIGNFCVYGHKNLKFIYCLN